MFLFAFAALGTQAVAGTVSVSYELNGKTVSFSGATLREVNDKMRTYWEVGDGCAYNAEKLPADGTGTLTWTVSGTVEQGDYLNGGALVLPSLSGGYIYRDGTYRWKKIEVKADAPGATIISNPTFDVWHSYFSTGTDTTTVTGVTLQGGLYVVPHGTVTFDGCTFTGQLRVPNGDGAFAVTGCTFTGETAAQDSNGYVMHYQAAGTLAFTGNTVADGYRRGLNIDNKDLTATVERNKLGTTKDTGRSAIQISTCVKLAVTGNEIKLDGGNAITLHENLLTLSAAPKVSISGNTVTGTGYLIYDDAVANSKAFTSDNLKLTYARDNTVAETVDTTQGVKGTETYGISTAVNNEVQHYVAQVGTTGYPSLAAALADVAEGKPLTWVAEGAWPVETPVYYNGTFYETGTGFAAKGALERAIDAANAANAAAVAKIYVRPGFEADELVLQAHQQLKTALAIYGNDAKLSRNWEPCVEYPGTSGDSGAHQLTKDVSLAIYNLHNGAGFWGRRTTAYTVDLKLSGCQNAHQVMFYGNANTGVKGKTNISVTNCTFDATTKADHNVIVTIGAGKVDVSDTTFTAANINVKNVDGGDNVITVKDCEFKDTVAGNQNIRVRSYVEGTHAGLTIENVTFAGASTQNVEIGDSKAECKGAVSYTITKTSGKLNVYKQGATAVETTTLDAAVAYSGDNVGTIADEKALRRAFFAAPTDGTVVTVKLGADITLETLYAAENFGTEKLDDNAAGDTFNRYKVGVHPTAENPNQWNPLVTEQTQEQRLVYGAYYHMSAGDELIARLVVKAGQKIVLDLNGHTIQKNARATHGDWSEVCTDIIGNYGTLEIVDSSTGTKGTIKGIGYISCGGAVLHNYAGATMTVTGVNVDGNAAGMSAGTGQYVVSNEGGTLTIDGANVFDTATSASLIMSNGGTVTIKNATLSHPATKVINAKGGVINIESASVTSEEYAVFVTGDARVNVNGSLTIEGTGTLCVEGDAAALTKKAGVELSAPAGFTWVENDGVQVLKSFVAKVGKTAYLTIAEACAALSAENHTLTLLNENAWDAATPVYWAAGSQSGYAATLTAALTAAYKANAGAITIVCRPGADVGTMTHGHVADDLTIYGNDAFISGGECDLEVDTYKYSRATGAQAADGAYLEKDITITAYELDNLGVWGQRNTDHTVTVNLTDCDGKAPAGNVQRVYISGTTGVNDITLTDCDFLTKATAVYSNADGAIKAVNCSFTGGQAPFNINHKANGTQTVAVENCTFTNCGDADGWKEFAAPIRLVNSGTGTLSASVAKTTITGTVGANGDILLGDGRTGQASNDVALKVTDTAANIQAQKPGYYGGETEDETKMATATSPATGTLETSVAELLPVNDGSEAHPYSREQFAAMTRADYIAAQERLGGTLYVNVGDYAYGTDGVLGNGVRDDTPGQIPDHSKLNAYGENGYLGEKNDGANGHAVVFVGGTITSGVTGYTSIDSIGTSLLLAVPAYTKVTFKGTAFKNVLSFDYQLYTSPWSQLGGLTFNGCTFDGIIVGAIASQELAFNGCTFNDYVNTTSPNNSNPTWIRPAYGNWKEGDNEGQGTGFRSLTKITFENNKVTSTRPVKFERIAQWEMATTVTATGNTFAITPQAGDTSTKNVGLYFGANAKFDLVVDNNAKSEGTAALYTAVYSAPNGGTYVGLPAGSTVKNAAGEGVSSEDALAWKTTKKITLKTTEEVASVTNAKGVSVNFATLDEAIKAVQNGETIVVNAGEYTLNSSQTDYKGKTFTIQAAEGATVSFDMSAAVTLGNAKITFSGVTFDYKTNGNYIGLQHADTLVYNDCTVNGQVFLYAASETFNRCTFNQTSADSYNVWTYGAKAVTFNGCTFNCAGKSVFVYNEGYNSKTELAVSDCEFKASAPVEGKAAIEIDTSLMGGGGATITVDATTTAKGFAEGSNSKSTLWNDKKQTQDTNTNTTVTVAGVTVFAPIVAKVGEKGYTTLAAALDVANAEGAVCELIADVTLEGNWTPIPNFKGTFDGKDHKITGLIVSGSEYVGLIGVLDGGTVKNVEFDSVDVSGGTDAGSAVGRIVNNGTVDNVKVLSGTVKGTKRVGGVVGSIKACGTVKNCENAAKVEASTYNVGGIVGAAYYTETGKEMYITNCRNTADITSAGVGAGGIVGLSCANVSGNTNTGAVKGQEVGGIVGEQKTYGSVTGNTNSGAVTNTGTSNYGTGGIIGWLRYHGTGENDAYQMSAIITVSGNSNSGTITGGNDAGGIVGVVYNSAVITDNSNTAATLSGTTFAAGIVGNYQITETPAAVEPAKNKLTFTGNTSTLPLDNITAQNKDLLIYTNGNPIKEFIPVAQIGDQEYATLAEAAAAATAGQTITLISDVADAGNVSLKAGVTLDGDGHKVTGNSAVYINKAGGTVQNVVFENIHNDANNLSAVYASGLEGTATITGCTFDNCDWDAIQATPVAGAVLTITGNVFDTDNTDGVQQQRYVHIQSAANVDFTAKVTGNVMKGDTKQGALEAYFFADEEKIDVSRNYIEDMADVCILDGTGALRNDKVFPAYKDAEKTEFYQPVAMIATSAYSADYYPTVAAALIGAKSGDTIQILAGTWGADAIGQLDKPGQYTNANIVRYKSLTIQPAEGAKVTFTSTLSLGYDDSSTANATMTVKNLNFDGASLALSNYVQVNVEGCTFKNGTSNTAGTLIVQDSCCKNHKTTGDYPASQVTIKNCVIDGSNTGAPGIRIRNGGSVEITGCTVENAAHNGILFESNSNVDNTPVKTISITKNKITEWNATNAADGGRALRLALGTLAEGSTVRIEGNVFRKETVGLDKPDFMKITGARAATVSLEGNDWNNELRSTVSGNSDYYTVDTATPVALAAVVTTKKEPVAQIGETKYETLQAAFDAAKTGDTVTLLSDITLTEQVNITKALDGLTLDGNGKTIICDTTDDPLKSGGGSALYFGNANDHLYCTGIKIKDLTMTGTARFAIFLCGGTTTEFTNVKISGKYYIAVNLYGTHGATMTNCDISNSTEGTDKYISAIWSNVASANPLTLNNSKVDVIAINAYTTTNELEPKIFVMDGSEVGEIHTFDDGSVSGNKKLCVSTSSTGTYVVKEYDASTQTWVDIRVAAIGAVGYATLADAIAAAKDGETVKLLTDVNGDGIAIAPNTFKTGLTVDFGGHTYTVGGLLVGSSGTASNGFQLNAGNKITFKNGAIVGATATAGAGTDWKGAPAILIQNYCDLTLKQMTVKGGDETCYTLSNNNGEIVIDGSTIVAGTGTKLGPFAFDVCRYSSYPSVHVTVKGASVIEGDVEISGTIGDNQSRQLDIEGGTFKGAFKVVDQPANIAISGGTFSNAVLPEYCAAGYIPTANGDGTYGVKKVAHVVAVTLGGEKKELPFADAWLAANIGTDESSWTTEALEEKAKNGLAKWQCYLFGLDPNKKDAKVVATAGQGTDKAIPLTVANADASASPLVTGGYVTVAYVLMGSNDMGSNDGTAWTQVATSDKRDGLAIPLTGTTYKFYRVDVTVTSAEGN